MILKIAKLENNIHFNSHFNSQTGGGAFTRFNGLGAKKSKPKPKKETISTPVNNKKETTTTRPPPLSTTLTPSSISSSTPSSTIPPAQSQSDESDEDADYSEDDTAFPDQIDVEDYKDDGDY